MLCLPGERKAAYAFVYPNLMINRYGPWMDTNLVLPDGPNRCTVQFEYWLDQSLVHDASLIHTSLSGSDKVRLLEGRPTIEICTTCLAYSLEGGLKFCSHVQVQQEDIGLCEAVQRGLHSSAYDTGRSDLPAFPLASVCGMPGLHALSVLAMSYLLFQLID